MTAICAEAGLTERYFYESFAHRDDALLAALDSVSEEIARRAVAIARGVVGRARGAGARDDRRRSSTGSRRSPTMGLVAVVQSNANARLRARRHELLGTFAELVAPRRGAVRRGGVAGRRARLHGVVFIAGLAELVAAWLLGEIELNADELPRRPATCSSR